MKIGIYGGTFNPPHIGHLITAECVRESLGLEKILFMPSYISPHKQEGEEQSAIHRLEMTRIAVAGNKSFDVSGFEISRNATSYTIDTLQYLKKAQPADQFFLIIGMDNYITFHLWKEPKAILSLATLAVMNRPNYPKKINEIIGTTNVVFVDVPDIDISSSDIRRKVFAGTSVRYLLPGGVEEYILQKELYRGS